MARSGQWAISECDTAHFLGRNTEEPVRDPLSLSAASKSINQMLSGLHFWVKVRQENALANCQAFLVKEISLYMLSHWDFSSYTTGVTDIVATLTKNNRSRIIRPGFLWRGAGFSSGHVFLTMESDKIICIILLKIRCGWTTELLFLLFLWGPCTVSSDLLLCQSPFSLSDTDWDLGWWIIRCSARET